MKPLSPPTFLASGVSAARLNGLRMRTADDQREFVDQLVVHRDAGLGVFRGEREGAGGNFDRLRRGADFERRVGANRCRGVQHDAGDAGRPEASFST